MKPTQLTLLIFGLVFITNPILTRSIYCPTFSLYYRDADQVVLAKTKSSGGKESYEIQQFYKGQDKDLPNTFCSCREVCCMQAYHYEDEYYILFVDNDSLSRVYHIGPAVDTTAWRSFFQDLDQLFQIDKLEKRHRNYAKWLFTYFQKDNFRKIIREELKEGNGFLFPRKALCQDTMHFVDGYHDECQLPSLFSKSQQYRLFQLLNKKQFFGEIRVLIDQLDLIPKEDLQKFFYTNSNVFFEALGQDSKNEIYIEELERLWYSFFSAFDYAATNAELSTILSFFQDMIIHRRIDNKSSIMIKLKEHILENRPMFASSKEENR